MFEAAVDPKSTTSLASKNSENTVSFQMFEGTGGNLVLYVKLYRYYLLK